MRIHKGWSVRRRHSLGSFLLLIAPALIPSQARAQSGWQQSVPPEVVLRFQPRTFEEAARAPRVPIVDAPRNILPARAVETDATPSPDVGNWQPSGPPGLTWHSLVFDSRRRDFLIVGGLPSLDPQHQVWALDPLAGTCSPIGSRPGGVAARFAGAAYDSLRDRLLVLQYSAAPRGRGVFALDAFSLAGAGWERLWSGDSLDAPWLAGLAIDTNRDQLVLIGVWDAARARHRLVRIPLANPSAWTQEAVAGAPLPPAVTHGAAVYEPGRDRFDVIFDSSPEQYYPIARAGRTSVWTVNASGSPAWTATATGPGMPASSARQLAFDAVRDRMLFVDESAIAWAVSLASGSAQRLDADGGGMERDGLAAAFDPVERRLFVHGGQGPWQALPLAMSLDVDPDVEVRGATPGTATWRTEAPAGLGSLWGHQLFIDAPGGRMIAFGGCTASGPSGCVPVARARSLSGDTGWSVLGADSPSSPTAYGAATCYDPIHHSLLAFGGQRLDGTGTLVDELWSLSLAPGGQWRAIPYKGDAPPPLRNASLVCDEARGRYLLMGGDDRASVNTDVWELMLEPAPSWRRIAFDGEPGLRYPAVFVDPSRGDAWAFTFPFDVHHLVLDADGAHGERVPAASTLPDAMLNLHATAVCFDPARRRLEGFLARFDDVTFEQVWTADLGADVRWTPLRIGGVTPADRGNFPVAYDPAGDRLLVVAGYDDNEDYRGDAWALPFLSPMPTAVEISLAAVGSDAAGVHLRWRVAHAGAAARVERTADGLAWNLTGSAHASGPDALEFDDAPLAAGARAGYRLRLATPGGEIVSPIAWASGAAEATHALSLAALPTRPAGALAVRFTLRTGEQARLSLLDLSGRRLCAARIPAGAHEWTFAARPAPGIYFAELAQGGERRVARMLAVR